MLLIEAHQFNQHTEDDAQAQEALHISQMGVGGRDEMGRGGRG